MSTPFRYISFGAGVQSTTLLLMSMLGEIEQADCAIFADTGDEPKAVYEHLERIRGLSTIPIHVVQSPLGRLSDVLYEKVAQSLTGKRRRRVVTIPAYGDRGGMGRRQCTREFKVDVIQKAVRQILGYPPRARIPKASAEAWIGISLDEVERMKPARVKWMVHEFPLIDQRMTRHDCANWLTRHGYPIPPKSACSFCPYHSTTTWRNMKLHQPEDWAHAVAVDRELNRVGEYVHRSQQPLDQVDFSSEKDKGQLNLFVNECEGVCGV